MTDRYERIRPGSALQGGFTFALLSCFAVLSLLIVLLGANVYRSVETASGRNETARTALSYIAGKVRSFDAKDMIRVDALPEGDVLVLGGLYGGVRYDTYIYESGGYLCECFARADRGLDKNLGDSLVESYGFSADLADGDLTVSIKDQTGAVHSLTLLIRSEAGGDPA